MIMTGARLMSLAEFVTRRRGILGLTQTELARRLPDWDRTRIARIENGVFKGPLDAQAAAELAEALECSQLDLLEAQGFQVREHAEGDDHAPTIYTVLEDIEVLDLPAEVRGSIRENLRLAARLRREVEERNHDEG